MTINDLINDKRRERGMSVQELGKRIGADAGALRRSFHNKRNLRPDELLALMVFFRISIAEAKKAAESEVVKNEKRSA